MTRYAVQCYVPTYDMPVVIVEADSLEEACIKGHAKAITEGEWEGLCVYGTTFVEGVAVNPDPDDPLDSVYNRPLDVRPRFAEGGNGWDGT